MDMLGYALLIIGLIISAFAGIWFLVVAFRQSVLWGLGCLFIPFVSLIFLIVHWAEAKRPFLWSLLALLPLFLGVALSGELRAG
jgi:hypothetical protein